MLLRRRETRATTDDRDVIVEHGASLAKGPALIVGSILVAFGLAALLKDATFPTVSANFPDGTAQGTSFLGFEVNGWTGFFCIAGGALLLFGAAQHHLAKLMSLLVGLAFAACAVIAIIDGDDVLGLAAANGWTELGWGIVAAVLVLNVLAPRRRRERVVGGSVPADVTAAEGRRFGRADRPEPVDEDRTPVTRRDEVPTDERRTTVARADETPTTVGERVTPSERPPRV